jgi:hypothetical protein
VALDSQDKRLAAMNPKSPWKRTRMPVPDAAAFSVADRSQLLLLARADFDAGGGGGAGAALYIPHLRRRRR